MGFETEDLDIRNILPHRQPFLFVDKILDMVPGQRIVTVKHVSYNEWFFAGHFPHKPVMPGVLILEAMAQSFCALVAKTLNVSSDLESTPYLVSVESAKFRSVVIPGDSITMDSKLILSRHNMYKCQSYAYVNDKIVAESIIVATFKVSK